MDEGDPQARVAALTRENARLRRALGERPPELPDGPFKGLVFARAAERFAVPVAAVREVVPVVWPQPIAEAPRAVLGAFSYDGEIVPLVDLAVGADGAPTKLSSTMNIVIVDAGPSALGLLADHVLGVHGFDPAAASAGAIPSARRIASFVDARGEAVHLISPRELACEVSA